MRVCFGWALLFTSSIVNGSTLYTGTTTFPEYATYDNSAGSLLNQFSTTIGGVNAMAFGTNSNLYVAAGDVEVFNSATGQPLNLFSTARPTTDALAFGSDREPIHRVNILGRSCSLPPSNRFDVEPIFNWDRCQCYGIWP